MLLIMALLLALSAGIGGAVRSARESATPERAVTYRPLQVEEDGYVSSRTLQGVPPVPICELVRLVPSHDDAAGGA